MIELCIAENDFKSLLAKLTSSEIEQCAVLYTTQYQRSDGITRVLVADTEIPGTDDYARTGKLEAELTPAFVAKVTKRAKLRSLGLVFVHTHVSDQPPNFSVVDDRGEKHLISFLGRRHSEPTHLALVLSRGGVCARELGTQTLIRVLSVGSHRTVLFDPHHHARLSQQTYDRQVRAFGKDGQDVLRRMRVAIIGLGGTGSIVAQELAHLGVRKFVLIDPDVVEESNLNRLANASKSDISKSKVYVATRYITAVAPDADVDSVQDNIVYARVARKIIEADLIMACTDSHGSRAVIQQLAYQYFIPAIDVGTTIVVDNGTVKHIVGRVQALAPGLACFTCGNILDSNEVRRDMMSEFERRQDPYIQGAREPAPAVMSLNGTVASLGVSMVLSMFTHIPIAGRHLIYNAVSSKLRPVTVDQNPTCYICSRSGVLARADSRPLNARED